ncbi:alkaline phosphatase D family protein [Pseudomonas sp. GOM7]|uniref:alkaline phosphatase D family protein n=1 Tax=Pseudomonas sp. GOM7 TaxID=2998079 RepID=UPI00227A0A39|nr:alkaline phosphatase D family protein [Pseudomonas sp. GOM7]WAJ39813.1 alkaline phosphatase D family protein [Pseudomonas sp. GOM7]
MAKLILGHTTDSSAKIWIRASSRWPVAFLQLINLANNKKPTEVAISTQESEFFTAVHEFTGLTADTEYKVKVSFGKTLKDPAEARIRDAYTEGRFKTFPTTASQPFTFLIGSCNLHSLGILERPDQSWLSISRIAAKTQARFMLHAGDQIYADIPFKPEASLEHYRDKYLDAWDDCIPARKVLTELPHYMILDDHEIINNYAHGSDELGSTLPRIALKVYWEFQHSHNPTTLGAADQYYYSFNYGDVQFFVLDTRTSRVSSLGQMIDDKQLKSLLAWMTQYSNNTKFIVTSVPFVGAVKNPKQDKWCDPAFKAQREKILGHILKNGISNVIFLTGDMHTSYCADMEISDGAGNKTVIHELMSSPINQFTPKLPLEFHYESPKSETSDGLQYTSTIRKKTFYGDHSNVMSITVASGQPIEFSIFRTTTDTTKPAIKGTI